MPKILENISSCIILVLILLTIIQLEVHGKIYHFTLSEKTRGAEVILLAKCIKIQDEKYEVKGLPPESGFKSPRFAVYKIIAIWKGQYDNDTIILDYKFTNEKYKPFICNPAVHPVINEQVILFIEKDFAIFAGFQGKIQIDEEKIFLYRDAITKFLKLDSQTGRKKILSTIKMLDDNNPFLRESMLRELHKIDNTTYGVEIANLLKHRDVSVRQGAISALIGTKEKEVVPFVIASLKDSGPRVRADATTVLWRIDDKRITAALMEAFNDESAQVRRGVIFALSRRHSEESISLYLKALKDSDPLVRASGADAFSWVHYLNSVSELVTALKDENARVRQSAVNSLRSYPSPNIIESVSALLADEDWSVREYAACCIGAIAAEGYREYLRKDKIINDLLQMAIKEEKFHVKGAAISALGTIGSKRAIPTLLNLLFDTQMETRADATIALSNIEDKKVLPNLRESLKKEKNEYVKKELERAIKQLEESGRN